MNTPLTPRQIRIQQADERARKLENPYDTEGTACTSDPRWHAFEGYRDNVATSYDGEFDDYTDAQLQSCAEEWAIDEADTYAADFSY